MNRRQFIFFFLIGGLMSLLRRKTGTPRQEQRKAMFWRNKDDA